MLLKSFQKGLILLEQLQFFIFNEKYENNYDEKGYFTTVGKIFYEYLLEECVRIILNNCRKRSLFRIVYKSVQSSVSVTHLIPPVQRVQRVSY
jgi:hypothetical protein